LGLDLDLGLGLGLGLLGEKLHKLLTTAILFISSV